MSQRDFPAGDDMSEDGVELVMVKNMPRVVGEKSVLGTVIREENNYQSAIWSTVTVDVQQ